MERRRWHNHFGLFAITLAVGLVAGLALFPYYRHVPVDLTTNPFPFDEQHGTISDIPRTLRDLDGRNVAVEGEMIPINFDPNVDRITRFALIPKLVEPRVPLLQETVVCSMRAGRVSGFYPSRIKVYGQFHVCVTR